MAQVFNSNTHSRHDTAATAWFVGIITALALLAIAYLVFAANMQGGKASGGPRAYGVNVFIDTTTGCEYLSGGLASGITPRMDANGKQICKAGLSPT